MARGHQKELAQQRNAKKNSGKKDSSSQKKAAGAALIHQCTVCKVISILLSNKLKIQINFSIASQLSTHLHSHLCYSGIPCCKILAFIYSNYIVFSYPGFIAAIYI